MKNLIPILILVLILLAICAGTELFLNASCRKMLNLCETARQTLNEKTAEHFAAEWEEISRGWLLLISHEEISDISRNVYEMAELAQARKYEEARIVLGTIRRKLEIMPQKIRLSWANFF